MVRRPCILHSKPEANEECKHGGCLQTKQTTSFRGSSDIIQISEHFGCNTDQLGKAGYALVFETRLNVPAPVGRIASLSVTRMSDKILVDYLHIISERRSNKFNLSRLKSCILKFSMHNAIDVADTNKLVCLRYLRLC